MVSLGVSRETSNVRVQDVSLQAPHLRKQVRMNLSGILCRHWLLYGSFLSCVQGDLKGIAYGRKSAFGAARRIALISTRRTVRPQVSRETP